MSTQPTDDEIKDLYSQETGFKLDDNPAALLDFARAVIAKWGTPAMGAEPSRDNLRSLIEGMSVSVDVSTGDSDAKHRYFGTVTEVMECRYGKNRLTLLVQDAEPNFTPQPVREPLTPERIEEICLELRDTVGCGNTTLARAIEAAHGITGGQHGPA